MSKFLTIQRFAPLHALYLLGALGAPMSAQAADWMVDPAASKLTFTGSQTGENFTGHFARFTGRITFDPETPQHGTADVTIDMASATTGDSQKDGALPQPEWFDTAKTPQAEFHVASFTFKGGSGYEAVGRLTIRGVGADVIVPFSLDIDGDIAHARGHVDLLRNTFGVGQGTWASEDYVAFKVAVDFDLLAHKAP